MVVDGPACMAEVSQFLHKCSEETVRERGALIPGQNQVSQDISSYDMTWCLIMREIPSSVEPSWFL